VFQLSAGDHGCRITVTFLDRDGTEYKVKASVGENMLSVAHREEIDLEGACEGSLACSTCHVIIKDEEMFNKLPEADDDENDMLDLAFGLTETCGTTRPAELLLSLIALHLYKKKIHHSALNL
jgi:ferredoxin